MVPSFLILKPVNTLPLDSKIVRKPSFYIVANFSSVPGSKSEIAMRHYSVSTPPGSRAFKISVQVEEGTHGAPGGLVSNYLRDTVKPGDTLELGMPFGTFKLDPTNKGKPVALIAGGIGCTVTVSMLSHIVEDREFTKLYFAHSLKNGSTHAYRNRVAKLQHKNKDKMEFKKFYTKPRSVDKIGVDYDVEGRITVAQLEEWMKDDLTAAQYMICGPEGLVHDIMDGLLKKGVAREDIQFECFGPLGKSLDEFAF